MGTDRARKQEGAEVPRLPTVCRLVRAIRRYSLLTFILLAYGGLAAAVQVHCADLLTSDGQCYLRMAGHWARGEFRRAIFLNWSPLPALSAVPLVWLGLEPRVAFRVVLAAAGALVVVGVWRLAARLACCGAEPGTGDKPVGPSRTGLWLRALATACAALMAAEFAAGHWVDLLLTALLLLYLEASMDSRLMASWRWALRAGALAGLAYLAKNYARPFFLVHFPLLVALRTIEARPLRAALVKRAFATWAAGMAGFALLALPWAAVLSARFGRVTFGTSVGQAYAKLGAFGGDARERAIAGLRKPPDDAPNVWQDSSLPPPPAPGLVAALAAGGWHAVLEQARATGRNVGEILGKLFEMDPLRIGAASLAFVALAAATARPGEARSRYRMLALALAVFCGGYALVYAAEERYFWLAFFVAAAAAFHLAGLLPRLLGRSRRGRLAAAALAFLTALSFGGRSTGFLAELFRHPPPGREHRLAAAWLRANGLGGPLAAAGERAWWNGLHTSFFLDAKYAGTPATRVPADIVAEMRATGATALLVWRDPSLAMSLREQPDLVPVGYLSPGALGTPRAEAWAFRLP